MTGPDAKQMPPPPGANDTLTKPSQDWIDDCMKWRGVVLTGKHAHWCWDWDCLPVDETTPEWESCHCKTV